MNILTIHTSHDGCVTYVENNKIIFHTQLDRYNKFKHATFPVKSIIKIIESLPIDKIIITCLDIASSIDVWTNVLKEESKCKDIEIIYYQHYYHHLLHAYCALTWDKKIKNILVCDGAGAKYGNGIENESLYFFNKKLEHISTESNQIGYRYEEFTTKHFNHPLDCGKTMAWSLYDERPAKIQKNFEKGS